MQRSGEIAALIADPTDPRAFSFRDQRHGDFAHFVEAIARELALELGGTLGEVARRAQNIISFTYFAAGEPYDSIVSCSFFSSPFPCFFSHRARMSFISMLPT